MGVEEQSKVHYAMPVRNFVYDAMEYEKQYQEIRRKHQRDKDYKGHTREEFISGFYKEDSIIPVITVILYFGDEWDGPRSLKEMMKWYGEEAEQYIQDYKLNLIIPSEMEDEDIEKLESSLREVFYFLKYSKDGEKLEEVIKKDDRFRCMETEAAIVVKTLTNMELSIKQEEENVNMCEAIEQIKQKATEIALEDGKRIGLEDGKRIGLEDGKRMIITTMYKKGYSALQIADMTDIDAKSVEEILVSQG